VCWNGADPIRVLTSFPNRFLLNTIASKVWALALALDRLSRVDATIGGDVRVTFFWVLWMDGMIFSTFAAARGAALCCVVVSLCF
jgi:hypothetical protein